MPKAYLGDGAYVTWDEKLGALKLTAENGFEATDTIYLEPSAYANLQQFVAGFVAASQDLQAPNYWMYETSGVLRPVVEKFINGKKLEEPGEVAIMRVYLRQWIAGDFRGPDIDRLREDVNTLATTPEIKEWIERAVTAGADPL